LTTPEARARQVIDQLLTQAGWQVCDYKRARASGEIANTSNSLRPLPKARGADDIAS